MNRLSKEKRDQLILVAVAMATVLGLIYFGLIRPEYNSIAKTKSQSNDAVSKLQTMEDAIKKAGATHDEMIDAADTLSEAEQDVGSGDTFAWTYDLIRAFKSNYKSVEIPNIGQASIGDVDILPDFAYKQIKVTVSGTAYFHDLGKFIADFENTYPHIRIANLNLEPAGGSGDDGEKLMFKMDIIALIKQNPE